MHKKINEILSNENKYYFNINNLLRLKLLPRKSKSTLAHKMLYQTDSSQYMYPKQKKTVQVCHIE